MPFRNPVIPGFHPDPSICRVGEDYYLATSSFAFFPGIPIHHSRDLVHWRLIGNAVSRPSQCPLNGSTLSGGLWAPTLRHHAGRFWLVTTCVDGGGNLLLTAEDPAGPWSEPVWFDRDGWDPSLTFLDDGQILMQRNGLGPTGAMGIVQVELDRHSLRPLGEARVLWNGTSFGPEAPHLYRVGAWWYLLLAEGGTHSGHRASIARARDPWGPFEPCPRNPILSHRERPEHRIWATGHGDLIEAHDGTWWMVFLGIRTFASPMHARHTLGRETFLAPVTWDADGWPLVNGNGTIEIEMATPTLPHQPWPTPPVREHFTAAPFAPHWIHLRQPAPGLVTPTARGLRLMGSATRLSDERGAPAFLGRRQLHHTCRFAAHVHFDPVREGDEAGLSIFATELYRCDLALVIRNGRRCVILRRQADDLAAETAIVMLSDGPVTLEVRANPWAYLLYMSQGDHPPQLIGKAQSGLLATEVCGGFTGVILALYATGNGGPASVPAEVAWFEYEELPEWSVK